MQTVLIVIHLMIVLALVGVVLIQRSEGGGLGIGGGSGFMSARGAANALTRTTAILAALFFVTSLGLGLLARYQAKPSDILNQLPTTTQGDKSLLNSLGGKKPEEKKTEDKPVNQNDIPLGGDNTDTTKPADSKTPVDNKTEVKPADTKTDVKPADAAKTDVKPADNATTTVKPADSAATEKKPADASTTTATDQKPATAK